MRIKRLYASGAVAVLFIALAPLSAAPHEMTYDPPNRKDDRTTLVGVIGFHLRNAFEETTSFRIVVLDEERNAIPDDHWRTDVEDDVIELAPGGERNWLLQVRYPGKYLACTRRIGTGLVTIVCATVNRPY